MCGFAGFWSREGVRDGEALLRGMGGALAHRGPDDHGEWFDPDRGVGLAHRRLSILDLSPAGHQPMVSPSGRYVVVYNGEIYNFSDLRAELEAAGPDAPYRGHSDTEVLLHAIDRWGIRNTVARCVGMFAFAVWDRQTVTLSLVRDRLGIKPLYYGWVNGRFAFGSELSAIRSLPGFSNPIDRNAVTLLLRHNCIPAPHTVFVDVYKQVPGTILTIAEPVPDAVRTEKFWSAVDVATEGQTKPFRGDLADATDQLDRLLRDAVGLRMIADVPLGAFLSGGVDSSTVVALMQNQSSQPIRTFSIGFEDSQYDEAPNAKAVAAHLGTDHTELYVSAADAQAVIPELPAIYDEPFADSSQIPTYLVSRLARKDVTVALSGDGGDELFAGYNRHTWVSSMWRRVGRVPAPMRRVVAGSITRLSPSQWDRWFERLDGVIPPPLRVRTPGYKMHKLAGILDSESWWDMYYGLASHWRDPASVVLGASEPATILTDARKWDLPLGPTEQMMLLDLLYYLPDDILTKVDRATMRVGLEGRVPILDHRVVEFAWTLPLSLKLSDGVGKRVLREVLYRYVPKELIERPKVGFGIPLDAWLRGPMRSWAEELLDEKRLRDEGIFNPIPVRKYWAEHLSGAANWQYHLWDILMFQAWMEHRAVG